uniref:Uncharacterized protein n=1 Tax=Salvator merianae TaxID=96440 RepID=A0A8D0DK56_SALMN
MNLVSSVLLLLLSSAQFGESTDSYFSFKGSWHRGNKWDKPSENIVSLIQWADALPCVGRRGSSGRPELCKRQEHQLQLWPGMRPAKNKVNSTPHGTMIVEGENDLSAYNWNSFGLRYGKRRAVKGKEKL